MAFLDKFLKLDFIDSSIDSTFFNIIIVTIIKIKKIIKNFFFINNLHNTDIMRRQHVKFQITAHVLMLSH